MAIYRSCEGRPRAFVNNRQGRREPPPITPVAVFAEAEGIVRSDDGAAPLQRAPDVRTPAGIAIVEGQRRKRRKKSIQRGVLTRRIGTGLRAVPECENHHRAPHHCARLGGVLPSHQARLPLPQPGDAGVRIGQKTTASGKRSSK